MAAAAVLGGSALVGCSGSAGNAAPEKTEAKTEEFMTKGKGEKLVCGRRGKLFKIAPSVIAEELGYFKEEGCNVEFQIVELAEAFASLSTSNLDLMLMGVVQTCEYIAKGSPMYIIGGTVLNGTEILGKTDFDAPLAKPEDFKGYNIGFHRPETGQIVFRSWLKDAGLDIDGGDVTFTPLDDEQSLVQATLKGEVDFCLCNNAFGYVNKDNGIKVLGTVKDLCGDYPCCRQNASEKAYKEKFLSLVDFEVALLRGYKVFKTDPETAVPIMVKYSEQKEDFVRAGLYGTDTYEAVMNLSPDPCSTAVKAFYEDLKTVEAIGDGAPAVDEFVSTSVYRMALDTLMEREPNEQFWKDLDAEFAKNNA
ncbi:MAG: ABC transporter substrate-binding protein [Coriobacteriia bacterium]|nr:ABC transporter substrate-binding protein [Coriobacteriia bacterium]